MNEKTLRAARASYPEAYDELMALVVDDGIGGKSTAFGEGKFLEWLRKYGPDVLRMLLIMFGLPPIVIPPIVTPPGPVG